MADVIRELDFANVGQTARQVFDLLINYLNQQPGCALATAEAVTSLALPFVESVEDVRNVVYFWGALFWIIKQAHRVTAQNSRTTTPARRRSGRL